MAETPRFSIVMGVYNCEPYLDQAVRSVVEQDFPDWELIVVDDGSTDGTPQLLQAWEERDARIRVLRQENSGRPGPPRNRGALEARGEILTFLDGDDLYFRDRLATVDRVFHERGDAGVVYHDYGWFETGTLANESSPFLRTSGYLARMQNFFTELTPGSGRYLSGELLYVFFATTGTGVRVNNVAIARSALEELGAPLFRADLVASEDTDLWLRLAQNTRFLYLDLMLSGYRRRPGSIMTGSRAEVLADANFQVKGAALRRIPRTVTREQFRSVRARVADQWLAIARGCREAGLRWKALTAYGAALRHARTRSVVGKALVGALAALTPTLVLDGYRRIRSARS